MPENTEPAGGAGAGAGAGAAVGAGVGAGAGAGAVDVMVTDHGQALMTPRLKVPTLLYESTPLPPVPVRSGPESPESPPRGWSMKIENGPGSPRLAQL
jgi:hypothetical protein